MSAQAEAVAKLRESHTLGGRVEVVGQLDLLAPPRLLWELRHPRAWAYMLERTADLVAMGRHFSPRLVFEMTRYHAAEWADHESYSCNNNDLRDLADRLRAEVPGASALMESRGRRVGV